MNTESFIKMGPQYVSWSSTVTKDEIELIEVLGKGATRKVTNYKVVIKDLLDMLLFRCHGLRKFMETELADNTPEEIDEYYKHNIPTVDIEGYLVAIDGNNYNVEFNLSELNKLLKINRRSSTWDNVKASRTTLDIPTMVTVLEKLISISIIRVSTKSEVVSRLKGAGAVVTKAYIDEVASKVHFTLDRELIDLLTPDNLYHTKYLSDSFVLGSEYCKNLHSFISYFADVFKRGAWNNKLKYTYTSIDKVAKAMGVRYNSGIRDYCKETKEYARTNVVQFVKQYVNEINEKTRLKELYGTLCYEIIREGIRGKVKGFKFYFEEA